MKSWRFYLYGIVLSFLFVGTYYHCILNTAVVELNVTSDTRTLFKIYYRQAGGHWSEKKSAVQLVTPARKDYSFRLADMRRIDELRIDTAEKPSTVTVHSIVIRQAGFAPVVVDSGQQFAQIRIGTGVEKFSYSETGFTVAASSTDPNVFLSVKPFPEHRTAAARIVETVLLVMAAFAVAHLVENGIVESCAIPLAGLVVLTLIVAMASISKDSVHPDESVHVAAATYYTGKNMPPRVGAPEIAHTYSRYGVSRLHSREIVYLAAGKFARLLQPLQLPQYLALRYFNVTLFAILLAGAWQSGIFRVFFIPLLLSPQIWYLFSYFNSEAFALTVIVAAGYQLASEDSCWNHLLTGDGQRPGLGRCMGIGLLFGLLLLLKLNFYFFLVFIFCYLLWKIFFCRVGVTRQLLLRVLPVLVTAVMVAVVWCGMDSYVNDFSKKEKLLAAREHYAEKMFKPSTPLGDKFAFLQMKQRGVSFAEMVHHARWGEKIFRTSVGEFGYTSVAASSGYYDLVRYLGLTLLVLAGAAVVMRGGFQGISLLLITLGCSLALMAASFYHAWTVDFQAQGRYLLPIVGMGAVLLYHTRPRLVGTLCWLPASALFFTSCYSFIFVALAGIEKYSFALG